MNQGVKNRPSRKGIKWSNPVKSEPWHSEALSWDEIKSYFPPGMSPCEAIARTVKKMKQMGLMACSHQKLNDTDIERIKKKHLINKRKMCA